MKTLQQMQLATLMYDMIYVQTKPDVQVQPFVYYGLFDRKAIFRKNRDRTRRSGVYTERSRTPRFGAYSFAKLHGDR